MLPEGTEDPLPAPVLAALERGKVIDAVKLLRRSTGLGLQEARSMIDRHLAGRSPFADGGSPVALPPDAMAALLRGDRIDAIRMVRSATGLGLKESKEAVESFERAHAPPVAIGSPGEVPRSRGLPWLIAILLATAIAVYLLFGRAG